MRLSHRLSIDLKRDAVRAADLFAVNQQAVVLGKRGQRPFRAVQFKFWPVLAPFEFFERAQHPAPFGFGKIKPPVAGVWLAVSCGILFAIDDRRRILAIIAAGLGFQGQEVFEACGCQHCEACQHLILRHGLLLHSESDYFRNRSIS